MSTNSTVLLILADHDRRVRLRKVCEGKLGLTVFTVTHPIDGLSLLSKIGPPAFILLSSQSLPLMTYEEFLASMSRDPELAKIPVVLLSVSPVVTWPKGVVEEVLAPVSDEVLADLVQRYCKREAP